MLRASYAADRRRRRLLVPGRRTHVAFTSGRLTSRRFPRGSRLVVVLSVFKEKDVQVDYGTGRDVSGESIADARTPLRLSWYADSSVTVPWSAVR